MAAAEKVPNSDQVHSQIQSHQGSDWSDVRDSLTRATDHRPIGGQGVLDRASKDLVAKGVIPEGSHVLAPAGDDFRVQNKDGSVDVYNSKNMSQHHRDSAAGSQTADISGRKATLNPDGTGTVKANSDDRYGWNLAHDALKQQGIDKPTDRQMANWEMQFLHDNHLKNINQVKAGHDYKLPAQSFSNDWDKGNTQFTGENAQAKYDATNAANNKAVDQAKAAFQKYGTDSGPFGWGGHWISKDQINQALNRNDLSADDKAGLQFMKDNYDKLKFNNFGTNSNAVGLDALERTRKELQASAEKQKMMDYRNQS
jgi:hypothetical protein